MSEIFISVYGKPAAVDAVQLTHDLSEIFG